MKSRVLQALVLGNVLAFSTSASADIRFHDMRGADKQAAAGYVDLVPAGAIGLGAEEERQSRSDLQFAQADDAVYRVNQLEEQVRQLNGQIEDMKFQILQMQEMIRKMQEETDFRLQELEETGDKQGALEGDDAPVQSADKGGDERLGKSGPSEPQPATAGSDGNGNPPANSDMADNGEAPDKGEAPAQDEQVYGPSRSDQTASLAEQPLGTITFDQDGNVVDTAVGKPLDLNAGINQAPPAQYPDSPQELYELGYSFIEAGNYREAQKVFSRFVEQFPRHERIAQANYWRGESFFAQKNFQEAARIFLDNHKKWPESSLAAQNMLKLGLSLAGLNQREMACTTYAEVARQYPDMPGAVKQQLAVEQKSAKCRVN